MVLVDGRAALWIDRGGKRLLTLEAFAEEGLGIRAIEAWMNSLDRYRTVRVERIDGQPPHEHARIAWFRAAGFADDYKGLVRAS